MQMINKEFGGQVSETVGREDGIYNIDVDCQCLLFKWVYGESKIF